MSTSVIPVGRDRESQPPHALDAASTFVRPRWAESGTSATVGLSHGKLVQVRITREALSIAQHPPTGVSVVSQSAEAVRPAPDAWEEEAEVEPMYVAMAPVVRGKVRVKIGKVSIPKFDPCMWPSDDDIDVE